MKKFEPEVRLSREMSLMDVTLIGVGAMIGAGIFVLTGIAAGVAGPALVIAFALNGLVALLTAMSYAELGSCYHDAGGGYLWVKEGLPHWNGFLSGWMSWFAHAVACSLYALGFGAYLEHLLVSLGVQVPAWSFLSPQKLLAAAVAVLFGYVNFRGASETGKVGSLVTIAKVIVLLVFVGLGFNYLFHRPDWREPFTPLMPNGWFGVIKAMGLTFIAFQGFEVISQCSEEVRAPRKNIPRAVFLSLLIVIPIYLAVAITALGSVRPAGMTPWDYLAQQKETALVDVAQHFFVGGGLMILAGGLVSTMSALNATIYSSSRVAFAMGRDRNFPGLFSRVHAQNFTPHWAIMVSLVIVVLMAVSLPIEDVASATDLMFLLLFVQVNLALISLRKKRPDLDRGFVTPVSPWLSVVGIVLLLVLAVFMFAYSTKAWIIVASWVGVGLVIYNRYASKREVEHARRVSALERLERKEYRVLVCVANPDSVESLAAVALAIAKPHAARIIFLHVIEVDEGEPLAIGVAEKDRVMGLLQEAEDQVAESDLAARSIITVSHHISEAIIDVAEDESCNFIVQGRRKSPGFLERVFYTAIDRAVQRSPSEFAVLHGRLPASIDRILIPYGENVHTRLALEVAPAVARYFHSQVTVAVVLSPETNDRERETTVAKVREHVAANSLEAVIDVLVARDIARGVARVARDADLVLMGGRTGSVWEIALGSSLSEEITQQVHCPVLWLEEYEEEESMLARILRSQGES